MSNEVALTSRPDTCQAAAPLARLLARHRDVVTGLNRQGIWLHLSNVHAGRGERRTPDVNRALRDGRQSAPRSHPRNRRSARSPLPDDGTALFLGWDGTDHKPTLGFNPTPTGVKRGWERSAIIRGGGCRA